MSQIPLNLLEESLDGIGDEEHDLDRQLDEPDDEPEDAQGAKEHLHTEQTGSP